MNVNLQHRRSVRHGGPIARTAEYDNNDAADNRDTYYLRDGMGGHTGLLTDEDDDLATAQQFSFTTYDAFGNHMSPGRSSQAGSFTWRGAEGSVYDSHPTLVYMQARHYDPTIGRFIQPDTLALASMTTQGMNRYIYCENDPVNRSDPAGTFWRDVLGVGMMLLGVAFGAFAVMAAIAAAGSLAGMAAGAGLIIGSLAIAVLLMVSLMGAIGTFIGGVGYITNDHQTSCRLSRISQWISALTGWADLFPLTPQSAFQDFLNLASYAVSALNAGELVEGASFWEW